MFKKTALFWNGAFPYHFYLLPKSDPNVAYLLPNAVYWLQCSLATANIAWAGQCHNSLFPWKLYKINLTAQKTINTAVSKYRKTEFNLGRQVIIVLVVPFKTFRKTSLGTCFNACNCLFESCFFLSFLKLAHYYKWISKKIVFLGIFPK